jgi:predicted ATPase/class 3 adenylate cyclase
MGSLPSGTVTFLFTDIEGSTKLAQQYPNQWETMRGRHHAVLQSAMAAQNGYVFQIIGDAFCMAFSSAIEALNAALNAQRCLFNEEWSPAPVKVRMGIHTGTAQLKEDGQYIGYATLAMTQRIMSAAHGGQVLLSGATRELLRDMLPVDTNLLDMGEKRLKDLPRPEALYQVSASGLPSAFPPLKALDSFPNNLPTQLTTFIGREQEIAEVRQAMEHRRLVTLTGPGGIGKTRLSLQAAADSLETFRHGVWFVELAPLIDPGLIPQTILSTIGISEQPGKPPLELLQEYLYDKTTLMVLDNCEHLVAGSARVASALLNAAPGLKILASSREALGVPGEAAYPVPSLSLPDLKRLPDAEQISQYEAVRLFIDRALLVQPHFAVTNENAPAVAQICHRLDGIALAIELAAARVKALSPDQIARRLDDLFRLLTGGSRTALERHQTLRAVLDWSYNLLSPEEKILLCRLSVFMGGWTLEAAEQVCGQDGERLDILDLLIQLVDKSLVNAKLSGSDAHYSMLESTRQYAQDRLMEVGDFKQMRNCHLEFFSRLAVEAESKLYGTDQVACLNALELEFDNFRYSLEWSIEEGDPELGIRLASALWRFWVMRGYWSEGYEQFKKVLSRKDSVSAAARAKALGRAGELAFRNRNLTAAQTLLTESLALSRELEDEAGVAFSLYVLERLGYRSQDDHPRGQLEESLMIYRKLDDKWGVATVLDTLSYTIMESDPTSARLLREECLVLFRELTDDWDLMRALHNYGEIARFEGDYSRAKLLYEEARALGQKLRASRWDLANQLIGLGYCVLREGDSGRAAAYFKESFILQKEHGAVTSLMANCVAGLGGMAAVQGQLVRAAELLGAAKSLYAEFETKGEDMEPADRAEYEHDVAVVREQLDEATFNAAWEAGQQMILQEGVIYGLKELQP